jgi:hypothetical protein
VLVTVPLPSPVFVTVSTYLMGARKIDSVVSDENETGTLQGALVSGLSQRLPASGVTVRVSRNVAPATGVTASDEQVPLTSPV